MHIRQAQHARDRRQDAPDRPAARPCKPQNGTLWWDWVRVVAERCLMPLFMRSHGGSMRE
jgi:hypothetical protein